MYEIFLSARAERDLRRLPSEVFHRIIVDVKSLSAAPRPRGSKKLAGSGDSYRVRAGEYRIVYEIDDKGKAVKIMRVRHRREAYR